MLASIDKYFTKHQEDCFPVLQTVVHLILREMVANPVAGDPIDRDVLQIAVRDLYSRLEKVPAASDQLRIAQDAFDALRVYNRETSKFVNVQVQECQRSLATLRELAERDLGLPENAGCLEKAIEQLSRAVEGPPRKPKAAEVPVSVPANANVVVIPDPPLPEPEPLEMEIDDITGLPQRQEAEICAGGFIRENRKAYFLAVIIDQMGMIDKRYGTEVKENVLMFFSQLLSQTKQERDMLFRWNDRCFLLLMNRVAERHYVRDEALTMLNSRFRTNTHIGGRPVMLNVGASHKLWHASEFPTGPRFSEALDQHLAAIAP